MAGKLIVFGSQLDLPIAASTDKEAVRKLEHDQHVGNADCHLPAGGLAGQVLVMTVSGLTWKWPHIECPNGAANATLTFEETEAGIHSGIQGVDINVVREVEII